MKYRTLYHGFWMQRYLTRTLMEARILKVYQTYHLDHPSILRYVKEDRALFIGNIKKSRDNCLLVRDMICDDVWYQLNELWLWASSNEAAEVGIEAFCDNILTHGHLIDGLFEDTLRRDEFFHTLKVGKLLEKMMSLCDVLLQFLQQQDIPEQSLIVLESFHAKDSFCKLYHRKWNAQHVLRYLIGDALFPNSMREEMTTLENSLHFLGVSYPLSLAALLQQLDNDGSLVNLTSALSSVQQQIEGLGEYLAVEHFQELIS